MEQIEQVQKQVIFTDTEAYEMELKNQTEKKKVFNDILKEIADVIDLEKVNFQTLEEQRLSYIIELFYDLNKKTLPPFITSAKALQLTSFDSQKVFKLFQQYDSIKIYKPLKIEKNSIDISVKQSQYDWFLNEDKKEQYNAVLELIEASKKLTEAGFYINKDNLLRATTSRCLNFKGLDLVPNYSFFKE